MVKVGEIIVKTHQLGKVGQKLVKQIPDMVKLVKRRWVFYKLMKNLALFSFKLVTFFKWVKLIKS